MARGVEWLARNELPDGGWGWCQGTTGFVETAAYAAVAFSAAGRLDGADRLADYVRGLRCADGGWCAHVPAKVGHGQASQVSVTPLGVVALARLGRRPDSDSDLRAAVDLVTFWLERGAVTTAYSLAVTLWALREVGETGSAATRARALAHARAGADGGWNANVLHTAIMCRGLTWPPST